VRGAAGCRRSPASFDIAAGRDAGLVGSRLRASPAPAAPWCSLPPPTSGTVTFEDASSPRSNARARRALRGRSRWSSRTDLLVNPRRPVPQSSPSRWPSPASARPRDTRADEAVAPPSASIPSSAAATPPVSPAGRASPHQQSARRWHRTPAADLRRPVSALDVSIQAQVLNCWRTSRTRRSHVLFISHTCRGGQPQDRVREYLGKLVRAGSTHRWFTRPAHPYTRACASGPSPIPPPVAHRARSPERTAPPERTGSPGSSLAERAAERLPVPPPAARRRRPRCAEEEPPLRRWEEDHAVACTSRLDAPSSSARRTVPADRSS